MPKTEKNKHFRVISIILFLVSVTDSYFLLKNEHFSQLFWFCNAAIYLLAIGFYFESSMVLTGILIGALVVQIPWVLDFLARLFFGYRLFGVADYMFEYGFNNLRFYAELDHLLIIPLSAYATKKLGLHKRGWIFAGILAIVINAGAYVFSSPLDNVNCVFYSCFSDMINVSRYSFAYMLIWTSVLVTLLYILNKVIYRILKK